uniref:Uncharacterized protein n=1 Tax=viral metagenome TaxID=1070528 RepID=A0A6C0I1H1_9ZZZZ
MEYPTSIFITENDLSLFDAFEQWAENVRILKYKYISNINIVSTNASDAILVHIYPSLKCYYFIKNNNSEYWLIFDPINTLKESKKKIKKIININKILMSENGMLIRRKKALNIEINVLLTILCITIIYIMLNIILNIAIPIEGH